MDGTNDEVFDLLIVGGGLAGATLACALGGQGLRIALVEAVGGDDRQPPGFDDRALALARATRQVFRALALWPALAPQAAPIRHIHVSNRGHFGFVHLDAEEACVPALGYVIGARELGQAVVARARSLDDVHWFCPATLVAIEPGTATVAVRIRQPEGTRRLRARLLVGADGTTSAVREQMGVPVTTHDYGQTAVIANLVPERDPAATAWERFTADGPLAVLPLTEGRCALVWTWRNDRVEEVMGWSDERFLAELQPVFGYRLGRFLAVGRRSSYPLRLVRARRSVGDRMVLVGNAAHSLHPVAAQGFNLGIRDLAALAELVVAARRAGDDIGGPAVLARYERWRRGDQRRAIALTDGLVRLFGSRFPPLVLARNLGMLAMDALPPAKSLLAGVMMGRAGRAPRLVRGLAL